MLAKSAASRARRRARIFALSFLFLFYITCGITPGISQLSRSSLALPSLADVSDALDEYYGYHKKTGRFNSQLLWVRAGRVSPADFWLQEAPKVKWLNIVSVGRCSA